MVKIDIISGFLGAGKTTFANKLLAFYLSKGFKPVYIVNEFGQTGLDAAVAESEGFQAVELTSGCVCCTLKGDTASAMREVMAAFNPTHIVFEPSGVFVFDNFLDILKSPGLLGKCKLSSVVTVVDSVNFSLSRAAYGGFLYNQIKHSPALIISKLKRGQTDAEGLICDLKNINPDALVIAKPWSELTDEDYSALSKPNLSRAPAKGKRGHNPLFSVTLPLGGELTRERAEELMELCASGSFGGVYRAKGVIKIGGVSLVLSVAGRDYGLSPFRGMHDQTLTFIGENIDSERLQAFLSA